MIDLGFASVPGDRYAIREGFPYGTNGVEVRIICVDERVTLPDIEDVGPLGRLTSLAGGVVIVVGVKGASR